MNPTVTTVTAVHDGHDPLDPCAIGLTWILKNSTQLLKEWRDSAGRIQSWESANYVASRIAEEERMIAAAKRRLQEYFRTAPTARPWPLE